MKTHRTTSPGRAQARRQSPGFNRYPTSDVYRPITKADEALVYAARTAWLKKQFPRTFRKWDAAAFHADIVATDGFKAALITPENLQAIAEAGKRRYALTAQRTAILEIEAALLAGWLAAGLCYRPAEELAKQFGITKQVIHKRIGDLGLPRFRPPGPPPRQ